MDWLSRNVLLALKVHRPWGRACSVSSATPASCSLSYSALTAFSWQAFGPGGALLLRMVYLFLCSLCWCGDSWSRRDPLCRLRPAASRLLKSLALAFLFFCCGALVHLWEGLGSCGGLGWWTCWCRSGCMTCWIGPGGSLGLGISLDLDSNSVRWSWFPFRHRLRLQSAENPPLLATEDRHAHNLGFAMIPCHFEDQFDHRPLLIQQLQHWCGENR